MRSAATDLLVPFGELNRADGLKELEALEARWTSE
jgi:hypothetical protein